MPLEARSAARDLYFGCFSDVRGWGGAATAARGVCAAAARRGWSSLTIGVGASHSATITESALAARVNVRVATAPLLWRIQAWRTAGQLTRQLAQFSPPRKTFVGLSPYWVVAAKRAWPKVPVIYAFPCLLANCLPFTWRDRGASMLWRRVALAGTVRAEHRAFELADRTFVPTVQARDEVAAFHPAAEDRLVVCPYGCETPEITPDMRHEQRRALNMTDGEFVLLAAGVCDRNKAFDHAIRELPAMHASARLLIVGDGPKRPEFASLAAELGVAERVHVVGPQPDPTPWYAVADCIVSTSWYDTFPNVVLEGMYHGRPVAVPRHDPPQVFSGIAETVNETGAGLVYDRRQPGGLASTINRLIADRALAETMGRRGRATARERLRWERVVDQIAALCGEQATAEQHRVQTARRERRGSAERRGPAALKDESLHAG